VVDYIPKIEYSWHWMQHLLRSYKAGVFQALGHPTRIAIVELLRDGELSAGVIQERLSIEQANVSQHLAILRNRQILTNRKEGNQVFYSVRNPVLVEVLDIMRRYFQSNLKEAVQMLDDVKTERRGR
jgi:DNA-binding transcriptional ArsR family regulator